MIRVLRFGMQYRLFQNSIVLIKELHNKGSKSHEVLFSVLTSARVPIYLCRYSGTADILLPITYVAIIHTQSIYLPNII